MYKLIIYLIILLALSAIVIFLQLYFEKHHNKCRENPMIPSIFRMAKTEESLVITKPIHHVFTFVTNLTNAQHIVENIIDVASVTEGPLKAGSRYTQNRLIHGNKNLQMVEVITYKENETYAIQTELFGMNVIYTYQFIATDPDTTTLKLTKQACGKGFLKLLTPLLKHLFTAPEHDGNHINVLKRAVENQ